MSVIENPNPPPPGAPPAVKTQPAASENFGDLIIRLRRQRGLDWRELAAAAVAVSPDELALAAVESTQGAPAWTPHQFDRLFKALEQYGPVAAPDASLYFDLARAAIARCEKRREAGKQWAAAHPPPAVRAELRVSHIPPARQGAGEVAAMGIDVAACEAARARADAMEAAGYAINAILNRVTALKASADPAFLKACSARIAQECRVVGDAMAGGQRLKVEG